MGSQRTPGFGVSQDRRLYSKFTKDYGVIVCLYVDDMLIIRTILQGINDTKRYLTSEFKMKDLGEVDTIKTVSLLCFWEKFRVCYLNLCLVLLILEEFAINPAAT